MMILLLLLLWWRMTMMIELLHRSWRETHDV